MSRKPAPKGATPLILRKQMMARAAALWVGAVGALLLIMGLTLSGTPELPTRNDDALRLRHRSTPSRCTRPRSIQVPVTAPAPPTAAVAGLYGA